MKALQRKTNVDSARPVNHLSTNVPAAYFSFPRSLTHWAPQREGNDAETNRTGADTVCGTPAFMAPEQALGNRLIDGRTDLYAVGCLAYWLITGQLVFTGQTALEVVVQHARTVPIAPSARTEMKVPPALDDIILACLAKNPDDRPASADALTEALASIATQARQSPHGRPDALTSGGI